MGLYNAGLMEFLGVEWQLNCDLRGLNDVNWIDPQLGMNMTHLQMIYFIRDDLTFLNM